MTRKSIWVVLAACATAAYAQAGNQPPDNVRLACKAAVPTLREVGTSKFVLMMTVDNTGRVLSFKTDSPNGLQLEKVKDVRDAVRQMRFEPAKKDGRPVAVRIKMPVDCAEDLTTPSKP